MSGKFFKNILKGFIVCVAFAVALILLTALFCNFQTEPEKYFKLFSCVVMAISTFAGGFVFSKLNKEKGLFGGLFVGVAFLSVLIVISVFLKDENSNPNYLNFIICVICSCIGGIIGLPKVRLKRNGKKSNQPKSAF